MTNSGTIMVVEGDEAQRVLVQASLEADGWKVLGFPGVADATLLPDPPDEVDVVLADLPMPGMDGRALLAALMERRPEVPVIVMTAHATADDAVGLMEAGAYQCLVKPADLRELRTATRRARKSVEERRELARLRRRVSLFSDVIGVSGQMREILETALRVAPTSTPVLVTGEPGTGKEVIARAIHGASGRGAFVALNCAAVPPSLFESELFGFRRGAFPEARRDHAGVVESAHDGTLYLDEVAEVPLAAQPGLLLLLRDGRFRRLGDSDALRSNARIIAATSRDLEVEVREGRVREDLYHGLGIVQLAVPPLRERPVDIPALAHHLLARLADRFSLEPADLAPDALAALTAYPWPGNIRELDNVLSRALALRGGRALTARELPPHIARTAGSGAAAAATQVPSSTLTLEELERRHILQVLERTGGNKLKAAQVLGIDRSTLHRKLKQIKGLAALPLGWPP